MSSEPKTVMSMLNDSLGHFVVRAINSAFVNLCSCMWNVLASRSVFTYSRFMYNKLNICRKLVSLFKIKETLM